MDFNDYQAHAKETAVYRDAIPERLHFLYTALGIAGEAGEVANKAKKIIRDYDGIINNHRREEILDEVGDVLWYAAMICTELDVPMEYVAMINITKLRNRHGD